MSVEQYHSAETSSEHVESARNQEPVHYEKVTPTDQQVAVEKLQKLDRSEHAEALIPLLKQYILKSFDESFIKEMFQEEWKNNSEKWDIVEFFETIHLYLSFGDTAYRTQSREAKKPAQHMMKQVLFNCLSDAYYSNKDDHEEQARIAKLYYEAYSILD